MVDSEQYKECEEPEISQLKELLSKVSGEYRAYLKGASEALLYVQEEIQDSAIKANSLGFGNQRGE